jgi:FHA domain-containing protein/cytochrome c3-like protein
MASKFYIVRKDLDLDEVVIESEGLTIGRLIGNDLVLNHPTVSRTQAGIKAVEGDFWIFNLSNANGTLLNGELIERTPLANGDLIQIGPFIVTPNYEGGDLRIEVELSVNPLPIEAASIPPQDSAGDAGKTVLLNLAALAQRKKTTPGGTQRLSGTGFLTGRLPTLDEEALNVFWEKRKREAGKLTTDTRLKPRGGIHLGKAQFNWRPTLDLQRSWPGAVFVWGIIIVAVFSALAALLYASAFSPGSLSDAHSRNSFSVEPALARVANGSSCTTCHALTSSMQQNCASCHTTPAFDSKISVPHEKIGLKCISCHDEHRGRGYRPALVANVACVSCHRDGSDVVSPATGRLLTTPHGGTFGYPVVAGNWQWSGIAQSAWGRKGLPGNAADFPIKEQFHLVHLGGAQQGRTHCSDCHTAGFEAQALREGVRESCATCHSSTTSSAALQQATSQSFVGAPACASCHSQHGEERNLRASVRRSVSN